MNKIILSIFTMILSQYLAAQQLDTVFLLKNERQKIYIDPSKNSASYKWLTNFNFNESDSFSFAQSLYELKQKGLVLSKNSINGLPKQWVIIHQYKGKYYSYEPSEPMAHYKLSYTDSCFIDVNDFSTACKIIKYTKVSNSTYSFLITQAHVGNLEIIFHIIDKKRNIAVVEQTASNGGKRYFLMIDAKHIKDVPVIINEAIDKEAEFDFEKPDYIKLIKGK